MIRRSFAFDEFLDFSGVIDSETQKKLFAITNTHPVLKNHPMIQRLAKDGKAFISISAITLINEAILKHSVALAKTAGSGDEKSCLRAIMEQNVLTVASTALNALMIEQFQDSIHKLSIIADTAHKKEGKGHGE